MICTKEHYFEHVEELMKQRGTDRGIEKSDFELLYEAVQGNIVYDDVREIVEKIIYYLYFTNLANEPLVPWSFWDTPVGQAVAAVKFKTERFYFLDEVAEIYGCKESFIYNEKKDGRLKVVERGREGRKKNALIVYEGELERYLKEKGKPTISELKNQRRSL